jgi:maltose O-acetyltransferase
VQFEGSRSIIFARLCYVLRTEKEKMLAEEPYRSRDPELLALYHRAKDLLARFAGIAPTDAQAKKDILNSLFGSLGTGVWIENPFFCDYGMNIHIGNNCFVNYNCVFVDDNRIHIGNDVLIGPAVQLYTATHPVLPEERIVHNNSHSGGQTQYLTRALPISIGDRAWIGGGVVILPGVTIGEGTTIGAGSVVTKDVPARCFGAGNPCRVIRNL